MADTVTVKTSVTYRAWPTPDTAALDVPARPKQDGLQWLPQIPLSELAPDVVDALAWQWLVHLYASVGRSVPFVSPPDAA